MEQVFKQEGEKVFVVRKRAIEHFKHYLLGTNFEVVSYHNPLIWLDSAPRLARCLLRFRVFDFTIEYREDKKHSNADGLSKWLLDDDET